MSRRADYSHWQVRWTPVSIIVRAEGRESQLFFPGTRSYTLMKLPTATGKVKVPLSASQWLVIYN